MPTVDQLIIELQARTERHDRDIRRAREQFDREMRRIRQSAGQAESGVARSFRSMGRVIKVALLALGGREIVQTADKFIQLNNLLQSAAAATGTQTRSFAALNDIASETRSEIGAVVTLYASLIRATEQIGATEAQVAQATELLTKSFQASGAEAQAQAAAIRQLGQALQSGALRGDELVSIRENAPIVARAIADEFGVAVGQLRELGAEGALTSERIFDAILNAAPEIEKQFSATGDTISGAFTVLGNAFTELVGNFDAGLRATENIADGVIGIGDGLSDLAEPAARFGGQLREVFVIAGEGFSNAIKDIGEFAAKWGLSGDVVIEAVATLVNGIISGFKSVIKFIGGVASAIKQIFLNIVASIADGVVGIANTALSTVSRLVNGVISLLNDLRSAVNEQIASVNDALDIDLPTLDPIANVAFEPLKSDLSDLRGSVTAAFSAGFDEAGRRLFLFEARVQDVLDRIKKAGDDAVKRTAALRDKTPPGGGGGAGDGGGDGLGGGGDDDTPPPGRRRARGGGGGGRGGTADEPDVGRLLGLVSEVEENIAALQQQRAEVGKTRTEIDRMRAAVEQAEITQRFFAAAQEEGIKVTEDMRAKIEELVSLYNAEAEALIRAREEQDRMQEAQRQAEDRMDELKSASQDVFSSIINDIRNGTNALQILSNVLDNVLSKLLEAGSDRIFDAIFDSIAGGGGSAAKTALSFLPGLVGFARGGVTNRPAIFGEGPLPEAAVPLPDGRTIPVSLRLPREGNRQQTALSGPQSTDGGRTINVVSPNADPVQVARQVRAVLDTELPGRMRSIQLRGL